MIHRILPLLLVLLVSRSHAQYTIDWSHPAADTYKVGVMAARDTADNLIAVGTRSSFFGGAFIFTRKYDKDGVLLWEQVDTTGIAWLWEQPTWVTTSSTNDIYVTGYIYSGTNNIYPDSVVVLKYDAQGNMQWRRTMGPVYIYGVYVRCVLDANDDLYVGVVGRTSGGFSLTKYDPNGNMLFDVSEANPTAANLTSMRLKGDRVTLVGGTGSLVRGTVATWDTSGNFLWSHPVAGYGAQDVEVDDALNTYVLTSYPNLVSPQSDRDMVIKKFDATGDSITQYAYDFNGVDQSIRMTLVNGRLTVIGWGNGTMKWTTFQTDLSGALQWSVAYDAMASLEEIPGWVVARENGDVFVTGRGGPLYQGQFTQFVTVKYSNGMQQWAHTDPYSGYRGVACVLGRDSAVYVLGETAMTVTRYIDDLATSIDPRTSNTDGSRAYPNPASDVLLLPHDARMSGLTATDPMGRTTQVITTSGRVDVSTWVAGVYTLRTPDGRSFRLVVQH